jgi:hypothetical protein
MIQTVANCFGDWVGKMSIASRDILSGWFTSDRSSQKHYETLTIQRCPLGIANTDEHLSNSASVYKLDFFLWFGPRSNLASILYPKFARAKFARKSTE